MLRKDAAPNDIMLRKDKHVSEAALRCPICWNDIQDPVQTPCGHHFCEDCIKTALTFKKECPTCRSTINSHRSLRADTEFAAAILSMHQTPVSLSSWSGPSAMATSIWQSHFAPSADDEADDDDDDNEAWEEWEDDEGEEDGDGEGAIAQQLEGVGLGGYFAALRDAGYSKPADFKGSDEARLRRVAASCGMRKPGHVKRFVKLFAPPAPGAVTGNVAPRVRSTFGEEAIAKGSGARSSSKRPRLSYTLAAARVGAAEDQDEHSSEDDDEEDAEKAQSKDGVVVAEAEGLQLHLSEESTTAEEVEEEEEAREEEQAAEADDDEEEVMVLDATQMPTAVVATPEQDDDEDVQRCREEMATCKAAEKAAAARVQQLRAELSQAVESKKDAEVAALEAEARLEEAITDRRNWQLAHPPSKLAIESQAQREGLTLVRTPAQSNTGPTKSMSGYKGVVPVQRKGGLRFWDAKVATKQHKRFVVPGSPFPTAHQAALARARFLASEQGQREALACEWTHVPKPAMDEPELTDAEARALAEKEGLTLLVSNRRGYVGMSGFAHVVKRSGDARYQGVRERPWLAMQPGSKHGVRPPVSIHQPDSPRCSVYLRSSPTARWLECLSELGESWGLHLRHPCCSRRLTVGGGHWLGRRRSASCWIPQSSAAAVPTLHQVWWLTG